MEKHLLLLQKNMGLKYHFYNILSQKKIDKEQLTELITVKLVVFFSNLPICYYSPHYLQANFNDE